MESIRPLKRLLFAGIAPLTIFGGFFCGWAAAQQNTSAPQVGQPGIDISGLWLVQDPGSGSWTDFYENSVGPAPVLAEIKKYNEESRARQRAGDIVNRTAA